MLNYLYNHTIPKTRGIYVDTDRNTAASTETLMRQKNKDSIRPTWATETQAKRGDEGTERREPNKITRAV